MNNNITAEQIEELVAQGNSERVTKQLLQAFLQNPQSINRKPSEYFVTVDYTKTFEEMVSADLYGEKHGIINEENFPIVGEGVVEIKVRLVHFDRVVSTKEVEDYFETNSLRAATFAELLAFGADYSDIILHVWYPVIALGSSWVYSKDDLHITYSPYFIRRPHDFKPHLNFRPKEFRWYQCFRFLAVYK